MEAELLGLVSPRHEEDWEKLKGEIDVTAPLLNPMWVYDRLEPETIREGLFAQALTAMYLNLSEEVFKRNLANYEEMIAYSRNPSKRDKAILLDELLDLNKEAYYNYVYNKAWINSFSVKMERIVKQNRIFYLFSSSPAWRFVKYFSESLMLLDPRGLYFVQGSYWLKHSNDYYLDCRERFGKYYELSDALYFWWNGISDHLGKIVEDANNPLLEEVYEFYRAQQSGIYTFSGVVDSPALVWALGRRTNLSIEDLTRYYLLSEAYNNEWAAEMA